MPDRPKSNRYLRRGERGEGERVRRRGTGPLRWLPLLAATAMAGGLAIQAVTSAAATTPATRLSRSAAVISGSTTVTASGATVTLNGHRAGAPFQGIGAISGGGGNSRLLIDYPARQRSQLLDYLFGPGGASLQVLKLEIGGDANSTDGSEPSVQHSRGQIDCDSGYEWWLAEQAVTRNPNIKLYGLQWAAPGWVGSDGTIWSQADIGYVIDWLNCARSHGLTISYLGGWNENGYSIRWYESLRGALDASGFGSVQIVADDAHPAGAKYDPAGAWQVAAAAAGDPAFKAAVSVIGVHDTCGVPTTGYVCESTAAARRLGLPLWESELGAMDANTGAADMVRAINNGYIQAGVTGFLEWPLVDSMAPGLPFENRGLITADEPQSGHYHVNLMTWAIAQTTQFVQPGWRHLAGANRPLGNSGTYNAYVAPGLSNWSLVAENTGHHAGQHVGPQTITVRIAGGLRDRAVHVWATNLWSANPARWFVPLGEVRQSAGAFSYRIPPGYVVTFTTTTGQSHRGGAIPARATMRLPYIARPDASNEAWGLGAQDGAFSYASCGGGVAGQCIQQLAQQTPVWWRTPSHGTPFPYAVVGSARWTSYTIAARVLLGAADHTAGLIGRFSDQHGGAANLFDGYVLDLSGDGSWRLDRNSPVAGPADLAAGLVTGLIPARWHALALRLDGARLTASIDGRVVARVTDRAYASGIAGIASNWATVQFDDLTVR